MQPLRRIKNARNILLTFFKDNKLALKGGYKNNMAIVDENSLLSEDEREKYFELLKLHGHAPHHFLLEVTEDQAPMDMNDINYVIIVKAKATHLHHQKSKIYTSRSGSGTWLTEFEDDLKSGYFTKLE